LIKIERVRGGRLSDLAHLPDPPLTSTASNSRKMVADYISAKLAVSRTAFTFAEAPNLFYALSGCL